MTFESLKLAISDWLAKDENQITDTVRGQLINMAQRRILRDYDLRFGEYTYEFDTVASDEDYSVPDGYSRTYSIWYMDGTDKVDLIPLTREEFDIRFEDNTDTGAPTHYTIWGNELFLGPMPDDAYSMVWNLRRLLTDLIDGSPNNENDITTYAWEYLLFRSLDFATKYLIEDTRAEVWKTEADRLEASIRREHSAERTLHRRPTTKEPG